MHLYLPHVGITAAGTCSEVSFPARLCMGMSSSPGAGCWPGKASASIPILADSQDLAPSPWPLSSQDFLWLGAGDGSRDGTDKPGLSPQGGGRQGPGTCPNVPCCALPAEHPRVEPWCGWDLVGMLPAMPASPAPCTGKALGSPAPMPGCRDSHRSAFNGFLALRGDIAKLPPFFLPPLGT